MTACFPATVLRIFNGCLKIEPSLNPSRPHGRPHPRRIRKFEDEDESGNDDEAGA
jgi:hypothetical protein